MAKTTKTKAIKKYKKRKPNLNYQLSRVLRARDFSPLSELLVNVYPQLKPEEKMHAIFTIMSYLYPKPKAVDTVPRKKKSGPAIQVNTQVNVPDGQKEKLAEPAEVLELLKAAETHE